MIKPTNNFFEKILYIIWAYKIKYFVYKGSFKFTFKMIKINLLKKMGFTRLPKLFLCPSHKCNANCSHCYEKFLYKKEGNFLTTQQCKNIINQFAKLGGYLVYFCSGEFLLRDDALELIRYCYDMNIMTSLTTNGILLDEKKIDELKKAGLTILVVSIDSANPEEHDKLRGAPGCFKKATEGLKLARKKGIRTQIWTYISRSHSSQLGDIAELAKKLDVGCVYVFFVSLSGHLFNKFEENLSAAEKNVVRKKYLFKKPVIFEFPHEKIFAHCNGGGKEHVCVMPTGDVTFCGPVPYSYGNIKEKSLKEILIKVEKDYKKFADLIRGQCPVNFKEYREKCNAKFIYPSGKK